MSDTVALSLKITEKVSFNIASEASYVYKSGQKFIKNTNFWKPKYGGQTVLPDRSILIEQKLVENAKFEKCKMRIVNDFQTMWFDPKVTWNG